MMRPRPALCALFLVVFALSACRELTESSARFPEIEEGPYRSDVATLASDAFEGRGPSSSGEEKTIAFLQAGFEAAGLLPGNGDSFLQEVSLVSSIVDPSVTLQVSAKRGTRRFDYGSDFVVWTKRVVNSVVLEGSDLLFVGYGIVAPEYGWNDYEGVEVHGKTVLILVNDPGFASEDSTLFSGETMTYYGRWTYKLEEAARQGAEAALLIHQEKPASYPWAVVQNTWTGPQFSLAAEDSNRSKVAVEGWVTEQTARTIFQSASLDFASLAATAARPGFRPVPLNRQASLVLRNTIELKTSHNVIARLQGSERPDEIVLYTSHWDHFGLDPSLDGDQIYNGAVDNATGTAGLLSLARAFAAAPEPSRRSVVFLAVTSEEQGLLGSDYYARNPIYPLNKTVAAINIDALKPLGRMKDVTVIGYGNSELDAYVEAAAEAQGRTVRPDPQPERGLYFRSDHFSFARVGVPAVYVEPGVDSELHGTAWTIRERDAYTAERYHKVADEYSDDWDVSGIIQELQLVYAVGDALAMTDDYPEWRLTSPFRTLRNDMMR